MADNPSQKSSQRSRLAKIFLGSRRDRKSLVARLMLLETGVGLGLALVVTSLLVQFEFQSIPDYQIGDIADRTIEAPRDFTLEDRDATLQRQEEIRTTVPVIFDLDEQVNRRTTDELRGAFSEARQLLTEEGLNPSGSNRLSRAARDKLLPALQELLPRFAQGDVLEICLRHSFSPSLENQMLVLIEEAMKPPGVVLSRDALLRHQNRGLILRNALDGQDELLQIITFLDSWIVPNVSYDENASRELEQLVIQEVDPVLIRIKKGRTLVRAGDEVEARERMLLEQVMTLQQPRRLLGEFVGVFLIVGFFLFTIWQYFLVYQSEQKKKRNRYLLVALILCGTLLVTKIFIAMGDVLVGSLRIEELQDPLNFYFLAPLALGAILTILLVGAPVAILYALSFAVFVGLLTGETVMLVYSLTGSLAAIYLLDQYRERAAIIKGGVFVGAVNIVVVLALQLYSSDTGFQLVPFAARAACGLLSGLFAAMLASLFLPILESVFGITTDIKLLELSSLNAPILRRLAVEAPGTYHHSIIVGTLAEAGAEAVGANSLLVRVGAYYHDIGKLKTPEYYIENQIYISNKHENLSPSMSSLILASHVKDGLALADEIKLVPEVRDLIPQHHGTRLMKYFYEKARDAADGKDRKVNENDFRYPGPRPQRKEAAILMLADQVEAAARTLQDPNPSQIRGLIRRLIQVNIQERQFDECDITMKDLDKILRAFERVITGMHHHRIEYPGFDFNKRVEEEKAFEKTETESQRIQ
jgi:putative nucleotidyltransferase with HDIG domain